MPIISRIGAMTSKAWGQFKSIVSGIGNYLYFWGDNTYGVYGTNQLSGDFYPTPLQVAPDKSPVATPAFLGGSWSVALRPDGSLWAAGRNDGGYLGIGSTVDTPTATQIGTLTTWRKLDVGPDGSVTAAIRSDGTLWMWGSNNNGVLGNSSTNNASSPVQVGTNTNWASVSVGGVAAYAITTAGTLWAWGYNANAQLGNNSTIDRSSPVQIGTLTNWASVAAGYYNGYAIKTDGTLWAWGYGPSGRVGDSATINRSSPVQIGTLTTWSSVSGGGTGGGYGLTSTGALYSWGLNTSGRLGINIASTINRSSPSQISGSWAKLGVIKADEFASAIKTDGTLWAWGYGSSGALGNGLLTNRSSPVQAGAGTAWLASSANNSTSFFVDTANNVYFAGSNAYGQMQVGPSPGISSKTYPFYIASQGYWGSFKDGTGNYNINIVKGDGTLWGWGSNNSGVLGDGTTVNRSSPIQIGTLTDWRTTATGNEHALAIKRDSTLWSWGLNSSGQLGDGSVFSKSSPAQIGAAYSGFFSIATTGNSSFAVDTNLQLYAWGANDFGQLGNSSTVSTSNLTAIGAGGDWYQITGGNAHVMAIRGTDSQLWTWGYNNTGRLGIGTTIDRSSPVQIGTLTGWTSIACGQSFSYAIRAGALYAWGANYAGQLGDGTVVDKSSPVQVGTLTNWLYVEGGSDNAYAIKTDGTLWAWGSNASGQIGNGLFYNLSSPIQVGTLTTWASVFGSNNSVAAGLNNNASLYNWGYNGYGELAQNQVTYNRRSSPVQLATFKWLAADSNLQVLAVSTSNALWSWGYNNGGQLGNGTTNDVYSPIQIGTLTDWSNVSAGANSSFSIKTDGTLWAWGSNSAGRLGDGTSIAKSSPVQIGTLTNWSSVSSYSSTNAIKTDGTLWGWGTGTSGQIGNGATTSRSSPVQVGTLTNWKQVVSGNAFVVAVKTDGTIWSWGSNTAGRLGDGTTTNRSSPVQIGTLNTWKSVALQNSTAIAVKTDGTLWAWGSGSTGALGNGSTIYRSSPVQVGTLTTWATPISAKANNRGSAIKTDGTLWAWGTNSLGELGNSSTISTSSPVQVGTLTTWQAGANGDNFGAALSSS